jgi:hypothetical protein
MAPRTGTKKLVKDKKQKTREYVQYCIDAYRIEEVFNQIPKDVNIIGASAVVGKGYNKHKIVVPTKLKKLGMQTMREHQPGIEGIMVFDAVSVNAIRKAIKAACAELGVDYDKAYFKYITLSNGDGVGKFKRCTKEIKPDETDLRKKLIVMGLEDADGDIKSLIRTLGASAYRCSIKEEVVRTMTCQKE